MTMSAHTGGDGNAGSRFDKKKAQTAAVEKTAEAVIDAALQQLKSATETKMKPYLEDGAAGIRASVNQLGGDMAGKFSEAVKKRYSEDAGYLQECEETDVYHPFTRDLANR